MRELRRRPLAALIAVLFVAPAALAQQPAEQQLPEVRVRAEGERPAEVGYQPKRASTATKTDADLMEVPQAVNVVPAQVLRDQRARTLDDALRNVSGITQNNTYGNTSDSAIKRGFGTSGDGSILRDGIRSQLPRNLNATTERVEVLKGPASLLWGVQEPGGVIGGGSGSIDDRRRQAEQEVEPFQPQAAEVAEVQRLHDAVALAPEAQSARVAGTTQGAARICPICREKP